MILVGPFQLGIFYDSKGKDLWVWRKEQAQPLGLAHRILLWSKGSKAGIALFALPCKYAIKYSAWVICSAHRAPSPRSAAEVRLKGIEGFDCHLQKYTSILPSSPVPELWNCISSLSERSEKV